MYRYVCYKHMENTFDKHILTCKLFKPKSEAN